MSHLTKNYSKNCVHWTTSIKTNWVLLISPEFYIRVELRSSDEGIMWCWSVDTTFEWLQLCNVITAAATNFADPGESDAVHNTVYYNDYNAGAQEVILTKSCLTMVTTAPDNG